mmetsp:Transcript_47448/g.94068  ORF Transcript_47448/g.94068 Transcript_47448/m.94068 type:complete len:105 (-) Transcript_47448:954-1268(-)
MASLTLVLCHASRVVMLTTKISVLLLLNVASWIMTMASSRHQSAALSMAQPCATTIWQQESLPMLTVSLKAVPTMAVVVAMHQEVQVVLVPVGVQVPRGHLAPE